jgi:hypothetical protein
VTPSNSDILALLAGESLPPERADRARAVLSGASQPEDEAAAAAWADFQLRTTEALNNPKCRAIAEEALQSFQELCDAARVAAKSAVNEPGPAVTGEQFPSGSHVLQEALVEDPAERMGLLVPEPPSSKSLLDFEQKHLEDPKAKDRFQSAHSLAAAGRRARVWKWTTRCAWLLGGIAAGIIAALAIQRVVDVQVAKTAQQQTESQLQEAKSKAETAEVQLQTARVEKKAVESDLLEAKETIARLNQSNTRVLLANLSIRPDQELGGDTAELTVDRKGVFHAIDLVKVGVTSPKDGFATLLWLDPASPQIYPKVGQDSQPEKEWRVKAGEVNLFPGPLPKPSAEFIVLVVITPDPSTAQIRKAIPLDDKMLLGNADNIRKRLTEELLREGRPWVAFCKATLAPAKQME